MRELEQLAAGVDSGLSLIMLVHGAAFFAFFRRGLVVRWRHTGAVALVCAIVVSGSLGGIPLLSTFGLYPLTIIVSVGVLAHYIAANWISLYLGAGIGSTIGAFVGAPVIDGFVWLAIVGPCVLLAFIGAGLSHLFLRLSATSSSL